MSAITASVVLYKTPEAQLVRLLDCISASGIPIHTFLIDHSPHPISLPCFEHKNLTYTHVPANRGYGAGHNWALRRVLDTAGFHFVLNPDIFFGPSELRKMIGFIQQDQTIGQLMPRVVYPDGSLQYLCKLVPTPLDLFLRRFASGPLRSATRALLDRFELRFTGYSSVMDVPYLSGCFMLLRVSALRQTGLFDERFFMYLEDVDLSRRIHAQFRTVFYPGATVVHDHAQDSYKSLRALGVHINSSIRYFNKWGWFFDRQRRAFNRQTLARLRGFPNTGDSPPGRDLSRSLPLNNETVIAPPETPHSGAWNGSHNSRTAGCAPDEPRTCR